MRRTYLHSPLVLAALAILAVAIPWGLAAGLELEDQVREIAAELRCPVCQNLSVADSPSALAVEMRGVIREQLEAGKTPDEVRAYFLAKYGDWVLLSPRARGLGWLVWVGPFAAAAVGLVVAVAAVRRWARRNATRERPALDPTLVGRVRAEAVADTAEAALADPEGASPLELERARLYAALRELDFDRRSGKLSTDDYESLRDEYEFRAAAVLAELESNREASPVPAATAGESAGAIPAPAAPGPGRRGWRLATGTAFVLVFGIALGHFLTTSLRPRMGEQDTITGDFLTGTGPGGVAPWSSDPARHLPMLLASARGAYERQDFAAAINAYKQVLAIEPRHPEALTSLGVILLHGGHVEEALVAIDHALAAAPSDRFALWAKGVALFEGKGNYAGAIAAWERLLEQPLPDGDAARVAAMLAEARTRLARAPGGAAAASTAARIVGSVTLVPAVRDDPPSGGALFIIARRGEEPPLAVQRIANPTFPVRFSLGPEHQMLADASFAGEFTLLARFKQDGLAGPPGPGDLEGRAPAPVGTGNRPVEIRVDRVATGAGPAPAGSETRIHHIHGLAFDPRDPGTILVATHTGLVRLAPGRPPARVGEHGFDLMGFTAPRDDGRLFASGHPDVPTYAREGVGNLGLLVSEDGGATWQAVALKGHADFHALAYSPHRGGRLYGWSVAGITGLHRITVGTWQAERVAGAGLQAVLALAASPTEAGVLVAGTERGAFLSHDDGETWRRLTALGADAPVTAVGYHPSDGRVLYAYLHRPGRGLMRSRDGGATWEPAGFFRGPEVPVVALAVSPGDHLALATASADVVRSRDGGRSWTTVVEGGRWRPGRR